MTDICKLFRKTVKRSDKAILRYNYDNWIHIKCNNLDKLDYEMLTNIHVFFKRKTLIRK